jgi:FkbM family methyltransferase
MKLRQDLAALLPQIADAELPRFCAFYDRYAPHLRSIAGDLYDRLPAEDQARMLLWLLKRWAKVDLVNPVERGLYRSVVARAKSEPLDDVSVDGRKYKLRDFTWQGQDFQLACYDWVLGVHDVFYDQYQHGAVQLRPGDVIIDAGAFVGDTAVLFHHLLAGRCTVHSFELLDENLALLLHNLQRNGISEDKMVINKLALSDRSGQEIVVANGVSQGSTSVFGSDVGGERVQTVTLDDYVVALDLKKVDFIKMDIEGSEAMALRGAMNTIRYFKPRLAICVYHKWDDVFTLPRLIRESGVHYDFRFKWVQLIDGWEAVLLATPSCNSNGCQNIEFVQDQGDEALAAAMSTLSRIHARRVNPAN